jgi:hypothetical protein
MVSVLAVLQDFEQKTSDMKEKAKKLAENLSRFKDVDDVYASTLHTEVGGIASSLDLANLHNENAQKRVLSIIERIKK